MGLFTQRPEFNDELPGLPGEPLRPTTAAERLDDSSPIDLGVLGIGTAVESIVIPVVPAIEIAHSQESGQGDPEG